MRMLGNHLIESQNQSPKLVHDADDDDIKKRPSLLDIENSKMSSKPSDILVNIQNNKLRLSPMSKTQRHFQSK